jgi:hypothetical protein
MLNSKRVTRCPFAIHEIILQLVSIKNLIMNLNFISLSRLEILLAIMRGKSHYLVSKKIRKIISISKLDDRLICISCACYSNEYLKKRSCQFIFRTFSETRTKGAFDRCALGIHPTCKKATYAVSIILLLLKCVVPLSRTIYIEISADNVSPLNLAPCCSNEAPFLEKW